MQVYGVGNSDRRGTIGVSAQIEADIVAGIETRVNTRRRPGIANNRQNESYATSSGADRSRVWRAWLEPRSRQVNCTIWA